MAFSRFNRRDTWTSDNAREIAEELQVECDEQFYLFLGSFIEKVVLPATMDGFFITLAINELKRIGTFDFHNNGR